MSTATAGTIVTFAATAVYRWLTLDFVNDHFVHVSRARQILLGELPVRDFFDPGLFLQYYVSAGALQLSAGTLVGEALLTVFFVSLGAALAFALAMRATGSVLIAAVATAIAVVTFPRLYSYPKVFLFVLAVVVAWRHASHPSTGGTIALAAVTALAFLFRNDHGVYIGIASVVYLSALNWPGPQLIGIARVLSIVGLYLGATAVLLLPFAVFIQLTVGISTYVSDRGKQMGEISTLRFNSVPWRVDWSAPLIDSHPRPERRVNVRWSRDTDAAARFEREARYALSLPVHEQATTWSYVVTDDDRDVIQRLVADPLVEDTHGIDRKQFRLAVREPLLRRLQRALPPLRWRIAPGILSSDNALAWLYYLTLLLPVIGAVTLWRARLPRSETATMLALIVLCAVIGQALVRESPDSRLPDVATPMAVLGAWIVGRWLRSGGRLRLATALILGSVTFWSAATFGQLGERLYAAGFIVGPGAVVERANEVALRLKLRPIDAWAGTDNTGIRGLTRYVMECTMPSDRLLVTWFEPQVFFYAERPFAGGQAYFDPGWHGSDGEQGLTIARLRSQRVPIVLTHPAAEAAMQSHFARVFDYLNQHYTVVARSTFGSDREYGVLVHRAIPPNGIYEPLGLPCYR